MQVHGGMGFVEETGAAQYLRDARITTIYEGTTGIQAKDLVGRKIAREGGATAKAWLAAAAQAFDAELGALGQCRHPERCAASSPRACRRVGDCVQFIVSREGSRTPRSPARCRSSSSCGIVAGGWQMARAALAAEKKAVSRTILSIRRRSRPRASTATMCSSRRAGLRDTVVKGAAPA